MPVTVAGAASVVAAMWGYSMSPPSPGDAAGIVVLLAAAIFAEAYPVPVERLPAGSVSLAAVFILGSGILFGWEAAVIVGLITRIALEFAEDRPLVKLIYNGAVYALAGLAAGLATNFFSPECRPSCLLRSCWRANAVQHTVHTKGRASVCVRRCDRRL